jgi:hypothetical protein
MKGFRTTLIGVRCFSALLIRIHMLGDFSIYQANLLWPICATSIIGWHRHWLRGHAESLCYQEFNQILVCWKMILFRRLLVIALTWSIASQEVLLCFSCFDVYVQNVAIALAWTIY